MELFLDFFISQSSAQSSRIIEKWNIFAKLFFSLASEKCRNFRLFTTIMKRRGKKFEITRAAQTTEKVHESISAANKVDIPSNFTCTFQQVKRVETCNENSTQTFAERKLKVFQVIFLFCFFLDSLILKLELSHSTAAAQVSEEKLQNIARGIQQNQGRKGIKFFTYTSRCNLLRIQMTFDKSRR